MDLTVGSIVRQVTAPVQDATSLARTAGVDQIASFLRDNPDQRATIETALAAGGRTGDLSSIVERAATIVTGAANAPAGTGSPADGLVQGAGTAARQVAARPGDIVTALATPLTQGAAALLGRAGGAPVVAPATLAATAVQAATDPFGRLAAQSSPTDARALPTAIGGSAAAAGLTAITSDAVTAAMRQGRLAELIGMAVRDGRLTDLLAVARGTGQLPALVTAARLLDGALAALANGRGGLSATELALFARAGLLSPADLKALHAAGVAAGLDMEEPMQTLVAPRDGLAETRFRTDEARAAQIAVAGTADPALAAFDAGAVRITSRAAVAVYGVLGPPGGAVIAADAFEGLVRRADGDLAAVERALALEPGLLGRADTLLAYVERSALAALRLPERAADAVAADWLPGGERAGGVLAGLADLGRGTPYREVTLSGSGR